MSTRICFLTSGYKSYLSVSDPRAKTDWTGPEPDKNRNLEPDWFQDLKNLKNLGSLLLERRT